MKKKPILRFQNQPKPWIVNNTNMQAIAFLLGPILEEWVGKRITLVPDKTQFGGGIVDCIRVRPAQQPAQVTQAQPRQQNGGNKLAVTDRGSYSLSSTVRPPPINTMQPVPSDPIDDIADTF